MKPRTIAAVVSLLLCSLACGFLNGEAEPEVSAPAAPAETAAEAEAEPIASASARTVILKAPLTKRDLSAPDENPGVALGCYDNGKWFAANQCPTKGTAVSIAAAEPGKLLLETSQAEFKLASPINTGQPDGYPVWMPRLLTLTSQGEKTMHETATITAIPTTHKKYVKLVGEAIGLGAYPDPGIEQLFKIDLDADGTDEVLFAGSHAQVLKNMSEEEKESRSEYPDWAYIGLRRVVGDEVKTVMLFHVDDRHYVLQASVVGFTDIDGDGTLEIVTYEQAWCAVWQYKVYTSDGTALGSLGGWGDC